MSIVSYSVKTTFEGEKTLGLVLLPRDGHTPVNVLFHLFSTNEYYGSYDLLAYEEGVGHIDTRKYPAAANEAERYFKTSSYSYYYTPRHNSFSSSISGVNELDELSSSYPDKAYLAYLANDLAESIIIKVTKKSWAEGFPALIKISHYCRLNHYCPSLVRAFVNKDFIRKDCAIYFAAFSTFDFYGQRAFRQAGLIEEFEKKLLKKSLDSSQELIKGLSVNFPFFKDEKIQAYLLEHFEGEGIDLPLLIEALSKGNRLEDLFKIVNRNSSYQGLLNRDMDAFIPVLQAYAMRVGKEKAAEFAISILYSTSNPYIYSYLSNFSSLQERLKDADKFIRFSTGKKYEAQECSFVELESEKVSSIYSFDQNVLDNLIVSGVLKPSSFSEANQDYLKRHYRSLTRNAVNEAKSFRRVSYPIEASLAMEGAIIFKDTASYKNIADDALSLAFNSSSLHLIRAKAMKANPKKMPCVRPYAPSKKEGK